MHLLCAIWVPETRVANEVFMEPVTGVERISKQRWKLVRSSSSVVSLELLNRWTCRDVPSVMYDTERAYSATSRHVSWHSTPPVLGRKSCLCR